MFNSPELDLIIFLSFIYFVGSLIISSINEAISGAFRLRPYQLKNAIKNLFFDAPGTNQWQTWVNNKFNKSSHILSLMKATDKYPSYIPAKNFFLAIIGQIGPQNYSAANLQQTIMNSNLPQQLKDVLADMAAQAQNDLNAFEKNVEDFYNNAMDRAGGVYKKWIRLMLLIIGVLVSIFLNLDTIKIVKDEMNNKAMLSRNADNIAKQLPNIKYTADSTVKVNIKTNDGSIVVERSSLAVDKKSGTAKNDSTSTIAANLKNLSQLTIYLGQTSGYIPGYSAKETFKDQWFGKGEKDYCIFFTKLFGILITAFAFQLSSGFWFDLMNKAVNIRATGNKPEPDKKKA